MLQQMGVTTLKAIHKAVDPPMSVAAGLRSVGLDLTPGGVNYVDSAPGQSPQAATPLLQINPDLATARKAMESVQDQIRKGLYNDLFKLILDGRSGVTASEIAAREEEKLVLVGPVLERLHDELFIPLMDRTFECMRELDMLPPCPPELAWAAACAWSLSPCWRKPETGGHQCGRPVHGPDPQGFQRVARSPGHPQCGSPA